MLYEGEIIKIFPETDVAAYKNWIMRQGFDVIVRKDYIRVGRRTTYYKYDAKKLGELIFKKRRAKGLEIKDLAKKVGVKEDAAFSWEIGLTQPKPANLDKVEELLEITKEELRKCLI